MARYIEPVCRLCRRQGGKLYLKGDRCYSNKCSFDRHSYVPGEHGQGRQKVSKYGLQLREKQKAKRIYGVLESQFRRYFARAEKERGITGENLLRLLERRLDNAVFRLGMASSRSQARQLVRHGHFSVNGRRVDIPSYLVKPGDVIAVRERSKKMPLFQGLAESLQGRSVPDWLELDAENLQGRVVALPTREHIDIPLEEHLIVELYSR